MFLPFQIQHYKKLALLSLFAVCFVVITAPQQASAYAVSESYIPPEIVYKRQLAHRLHLPQRVNLNNAGLSELMTLPGFDENVALKLMRIRPVENIRDLQNIPWTTPKQIKNLIDGIQHRVEL